MRSRRARDDARRFVLEGPMLVAEALSSGVAIDALFVRAGHDAPDLASAVASGGGEVWSLEPHVLAGVASTESPQPVLATATFVDVGVDEALDADAPSGAAPLVVVAAGVREPGNLGTIVRSALGAGASAMVSCDDAVDLYNPKVVRAAAGALFALPVVRDAAMDAVAAALSAREIIALGLDGTAAVSIDAMDLTVRVAIVVGNEAHGLSQAARSVVDETMAIPLLGGLESLNAAAAVTVSCFEAARQRRSRSAPRP